MNEEDIKILEDIIKQFKNNREIFYNINEKEIKALENLINRNKELEKDIYTISENPEWLKHYWIGRKEVDNYWKSKIKEKIEEVNKSNGYSPVNKILIEQVLNSILKIGG